MAMFMPNYKKAPKGKGLKRKDMVEGNVHAKVQEGPLRKRVEMKGHGGGGRLQDNDAM